MNVWDFNDEQQTQIILTPILKNLDKDRLETNVITVITNNLLGYDENDENDLLSTELNSLLETNDDCLRVLQHLKWKTPS